MNKLKITFLFIFISAVAYAAIPHRIIESVLQIGDGTTQDIKIEAEIGSGVNNPYLKLDSASGKWQFLNVGGTAPKNLGSGSGSGGSDGVNYLTNPGSEDQLEGWSNSGGLFTSEIYVNGTEGNERYFRFVASGAGQYIETDLTVVPDNATLGGMVDFRYTTTSNDFIYKVCSDAGCATTPVQDVSITAASSWIKVPTSVLDLSPTANLKLRIESTASGTIDIDEAYLGTNKGFIAGEGQKIQRLEYDETLGVQNDSAEWQFNASLNSGSFVGDQLIVVEDDPANTRTKFVATQDLIVDVTWQYFVSGAGIAYIYKNGSLLIDGHYQGANSGQTAVAGTINLSAGEYITLGSSAGGISSNVRITMSVRGANKGQEAFVPEQAEYFASVTVGGANFTFSNVGSTLTEILNGSLSLVNKVGNSSIACANGFAPGTTTCPSSNESLGVEFNMPVSGKYEVCAAVPIDSTNSNGVRIYRVDVNNNVLEESSELLYMNQPTGITSRICGQFNIPAAGGHIFKLMYRGNGNATIVMDRSATVNTREVTFSAKMTNNFAARPIINDMVDTKYAAGLRVEACNILNNGTATTNSDSCSSWVQSVSRTGAGVVDITIKAGIFSEISYCKAGSQIGSTRICNELFTKNGSVVTSTCLALPSTPLDTDHGIYCVGRK